MEKRWIGVTVVVAVGGIAFSLLALPSWGGPEIVAQSSTPVPQTTAAVTTAILPTVQSSVPTVQPRETLRPIVDVPADQPPERRALEQRYTDAMATARTRPAPPRDPVGGARSRPAAPPDVHPTPGLPLPPTPPLLIETERRVAGAGTIIESGLSPYRPSQYVIENKWVEDKGNAVVVVLAGAEQADPGAFTDSSQGIVLVESQLKSSTTRSQPELFRTPTKEGGVRIIGAEGEILTLVSKLGTTFRFSVATRQFVP